MQFLTLCSVLSYVVQITKDFYVWQGMLRVFLVLFIGFIILSLIFKAWVLTALMMLIHCVYGMFLLFLGKLIMFEGLHQFEKEEFLAGSIMIYLDAVLLPFYMCFFLGNKKKG